MSATLYCTRCLTTFLDDTVQCPNLGCRSDRPGHGWPRLLGEGELLDRHYRILRVIAGGAAGMTYLARELDGSGEQILPDLAIKVLYQQRDSGPFLRRLANEAQILQELDSDHIVQCLGFVHRSGHPPYLITRFEPGGTLQHHLHRVGTLPLPVAAATTLQIVRGLAVAHRANIVHRDLKPGNVLLRAEVGADEVPLIKIADFGIAKVTGSLGGLTRIGAFVGTPEYAAPEQFLGQEPSGATDLFATGGLLWFLVTGKAPVQLSQRHDPLHSHEEVLDQIPPQLPTRYLQAGGQPIQQVLDNIMVADPTKRWTASQVEAALLAIIDGGHAKTPAPLHAEPMVGAGGTILMDDFDDDDDDDTPPPAPPRVVRKAQRTPLSRVEPPAAAARAPAPPPAAAGTPAPPTESTMEGLFAFADAEPEPARGRSVLGWEDDPVESTRTGGRTDFAAGAFEGGADAEVIIEAEIEDLDDLMPGVEEPLPEDLPGLLAALARARPQRRRAVADAIAAQDPRELGPTLRRARSDDDPDLRRGAALAAGLLGRTDQSSMLRALLRDRDATVRAAAVEAMGHTAAGSALVQLARALQDADAPVRAAAALAVANAYVRDGDRRRGRQHLDILGNDRNPEVRKAWTDGLALLDER